jgi:excisionase family DNA binding protein
MIHSQLEAMMTVREVADFLRLAPSTVYKLAQNGQIPAHKVGRGWRFSRSALTHWLHDGDAQQSHLHLHVDSREESLGFIPSISNLG